MYLPIRCSLDLCYSTWTMMPIYCHSGISFTVIPGGHTGGKMDLYPESKNHSHVGFGHQIVQVSNLKGTCQCLRTKKKNPELGLRIKFPDWNFSCLWIGSLQERKGSSRVFKTVKQNPCSPGQLSQDLSLHFLTVPEGGLLISAFLPCPAEGCPSQLFPLNHCP